jgi:hypothetical protein
MELFEDKIFNFKIGFKLKGILLLFREIYKKIKKKLLF